VKADERVPSHLQGGHRVLGLSLSSSLRIVPHLGQEEGLEEVASPGMEDANSANLSADEARIGGQFQQGF
jgi:hypothetical protein